jgi:hypothetical protein
MKQVAVMYRVGFFKMCSEQILVIHDINHPAQRGDSIKLEHCTLRSEWANNSVTYLFLALFDLDPVTCRNTEGFEIVHFRDANVRYH